MLDELQLGGPRVVEPKEPDRKRQRNAGEHGRRHLDQGVAAQAEQHRAADQRDEGDEREQMGVYPGHNR